MITDYAVAQSSPVQPSWQIGADRHVVRIDGSAGPIPEEEEQNQVLNRRRAGPSGTAYLGEIAPSAAPRYLR